MASPSLLSPVEEAARERALSETKKLTPTLLAPEHPELGEGTSVGAEPVTTFVPPDQAALPEIRVRSGVCVSALWWM